MSIITLTVQPADADKRIDRYLSDCIDGLTRSAAQRLLSEQAVTYPNGKPFKKSDKLSGTETLIIDLPEPREINVAPENIPLDVIYEDGDIIVINKPRGMVVHPAAGNWSGTLVNALLYHCGDSLSGINGAVRPGIVHRIDKDTSGLLVVAKNDKAHQSLAAQIATHTARREYNGIVIGTLKDERGAIDKPIARHLTDRKKMAVVPPGEGKEAITHYQVIRQYAGYAYMTFQLETGRTHQIRVHMASIGHPIIGDPAYGRPKDRFSNIGGQCLHAKSLTLSHPTTGEQLCFSAPLPQYFTDILTKLERLS